MSIKNPLFNALIFILCLALNACVSVGGIADALSTAVLNQSDPDTVRDGLPAYLIFIDALIQDNEDDSELLSAGAKLYDAYAGAFVEDVERAKKMSLKAIAYARQALCVELDGVCHALNRPLDEFRAAIDTIDDKDDIPILFTLASVWAGWIQANTSNWQAIADLPKVELTIERILALDESYDKGAAHLYMGVLLTLRPAALGGNPEKGSDHFKRAIELSSDQNLMAKVLYARHYARLVFDRDLHDRLLQEVLSAEVEAPRLTLINVLAKKQAKILMDSSSDYF